MKRILTLLLVLALSVAAFTSCAVVDTVKGWFHQHDFVDGKCECGESDPDYVPEPEVDEGLQGAYDYVHQLYKEMKNTAGNYDLITSVDVEGVVYPVTWSVDVESITFTDKTDEKTGAVLKTVNVPSLELGDPAISYKLTFVVTNTTTKETMTRTYDLVVPEFKILTYDEYMKAEKDDVVTVQGIVVALNSIQAGNKRNHIFLADESGRGGYYCYKMTSDPVADGIAVGMTVAVTGPISPSNGMQEIYEGTATIIDKTIKSVSPVDITEAFAAGDSLENYIALPVTIKGVTLGSQDLATENSQYLYFSLNGKTSYIRTYVTDLPHNVVGDKTFKTTVDELHAEKAGWSADVTGLLVLFSKSPYLIPMSVDCFENFKLPVLGEEDEIKHEVAKLPLDKCYTANGEVTLPTVGVDYPDVAFTWSVNDSNLAYDSTTNKLNITVPANANTKATISYTAVSGETTITGSVEIVLIDPSNIANKLAAAVYGVKFENETLSGVVISIDSAYSDSYKNITVTIAVDGANGATMQLYRLKLAEGATVDLAKLAVGDTITVNGNITYYSGKVQLAEACTISALKTNAKVLEEVNALESGAKVSGALTGKVVSIDNAYNSQYGNVSLTILVGDTKIGAYRIVGEKASVVKVGDTITIQGTIENGSHGKQFIQGSVIVAYTEGTVYVPSTVTSPAADTPYVLYLVQGNLGKVLYANGALSGNYIALTESAGDAVTVYLEEVTGGYKLYFKDGETKKYFDIYNYGSGIGVTIRTEATAVYTIGSDNLLVANVENKNYTFGTSGTYNTISKQYADSKTTFFAYLGVITEESKAADADKIAIDKAFLNIKTDFNKNGTLNLPVEGGYKGVTISWTAEGATITDNAIAIVVGDNAQEIKLTATIVSGEATVTKEFTVTVTSKAAIEKDALNITTSFTADGTLELPTAGKTYTDVVISWTTADGNAVTGPVTITQTDAAQELKLTATIKSGETTETKEFTVTVSAKPAAGTTVGSADLGTLNTNTSYASYTTTNGWKTANAAIVGGNAAGADQNNNPNFGFISTDATVRAAVLNGKTSAIGSLVSPTLKGGIQSLSLKYGLPFGDTKIKFTISIKQGDTVVASKVVEVTSATSKNVYELNWTLDTVIKGDFTIEIVNNCPSNSSSNKDRTAIWDIQWVSAPAEA